MLFIILNQYAGKVWASDRTGGIKDNEQETYDTLIPLFGGLFITYQKIDLKTYQAFSHKAEQNAVLAYFTGGAITPDTKKWGVIDSSGTIVVPFICDGVIQVSDSSGIISVYSTSYSLNTGIPRYAYFGTSYIFDRKGINQASRTAFNLTIVYLADYHNPEFVIRLGHRYYLPEQVRVSGQR